MGGTNQVSPQTEAPDLGNPNLGPATSNLFGAQAGPAKPSDPNATTKLALLNLFGGLKNPQQSPSLPSMPVQQIHMDSNPMGNVPAPNTQGNYPNSSMIRRGQFGR